MFNRKRIKELEEKNELQQKRIIALEKSVSAKDSEMAFLRKDFKLKLENQLNVKRAVISDLNTYMDPLPEEAEARKEMVGKIAGWFQGELRDVILHMIQRMEKEIARFPLEERETDFYRAGINFGHLLLDWGTDVVSEHYANVNQHKQPEDAFSREEDESIENIKEVINN